MRSTESLETVGVSETVEPEEDKSKEAVVGKAKSDFSASSCLPAMKSFSNSRPKKKPEVRPTLAELQKGAEKINGNLAELQRDIKVLLEQIKEMQTHSNVE